MKNKKEKAPVVAHIKRTLKDFVADEDGYVRKETILKVGLATVAGIGVLGGASDTFARRDHTNRTEHTNLVDFSVDKNAQGCEVPDEAVHTNGAKHCQHTSY